MQAHVASIHHSEKRGAVSVVADCSRECMECSKSCLNNVDELMKAFLPPGIVGYIRAQLDCAEICAATLQKLAHRRALETHWLLDQLDICRKACLQCALEATPFAEWDGCRSTREACIRCADACEEVIDFLTS